MTADNATRWPAVWIIFSAGLAAGAHICKVPPALPLLREDFGLSLVQSGFIATMFYVMGGLVGVFVGALVDRYGQKRYALIGRFEQRFAPTPGVAPR